MVCEPLHSTRRPPAVAAHCSRIGTWGNESYPGIFQPFGGFADDTPIENSYVTLSDVPGIGFESKKELFRLLKTLSDN